MKIGTLYNKLDDLVMKGTTKAVQTYNWTTGRTRADLAKDLSTIGTILFSSGALMNDINKNRQPVLAAMLSGGFIFVTHLFHKFYDELDNLEQKAAHDGFKDIKVESKKQDLKYGGTIIISSVVPHFLLNRCETSIIGSGVFSLGASCYVMRTDYLPPRKNCISRGVNKVKEAIKQYKEQRALQPALVTNRFYLEDRK